MASALSSLSSETLLNQLQGLIGRGRSIEADLIEHLGEVDARRLYLDQACTSMFVYCVELLHFSEAAAYKRIAAARAARRHPALLEAVRAGELHVTAVGLLAPQLEAGNAAELIAAARHRTAEEIRRLLADRKPRPDVPTSIRRAAAPAPVAPATTELAAPPVAQPFATAPATPLPPARKEALGGERYCVRFTADSEVSAQLRELQALMRHQIPDGDLGKILGQAVGVLLEQVRKRKLAETSAPRTTSVQSRTRPSRHIPAAIRRAVAQRDGERCSYVGSNGRRCGAGEFLEFDHREPWARTRAHSVDGIRLRCRAHNQHAADRDFGQPHMDRCRGRTGEGIIRTSGTTTSPRASCQLDLEPVNARGAVPRE